MLDRLRGKRDYIRQVTSWGGVAVTLVIIFLSGAVVAPAPEIVRGLIHAS